MKRSLLVLLSAIPVVLFGLQGTAHATDSFPVPIPGGISLDDEVIHVWAPGPESFGLMGLDVEPNTITNFNGFAAMAYINGTATDTDGNIYNMIDSDMRVFRGTYVSGDGSVHRGTFAFI